MEVGQVHVLLLQERKDIKTAHLVLVVKVASPPRSIERRGCCSVTVKDGGDNRINVIVELKRSEIQGRDFMSYVRGRFVPGTTLCLRNILMFIQHDGFHVWMDMEDADSEIYFCGDDALPSADDVLDRGDGDGFSKEEVMRQLASLEGRTLGDRLRVLGGEHNRPAGGRTWFTA